MTRKKPLINLKDKSKRVLKVLHFLFVFKMNKISKICNCKIFCINGRSDRDMVNLGQFSPSLKISISKKADDESQKKTPTVGEPKEREKNKRTGSELNSLRASRGSVGTISLIQTPKRLHEFPLTVGFTSPGNLQPPSTEASLKSPPIGTISADTPVRSARFHKNILRVAECKFRILGKGSFGTIIQATYKGELVAAKIVPPQKINSLRNELNNFLLSHPNIVKTIRIVSNEESGSCGLVIMEMCSSFTLLHLSNEDSLSTNSLIRFMTDIGKALDYCHHQRVLHLDVKPQNILVNVSTKVCKLCDFGSSCLYLGDESSNNTDYKTLQSTVVYTSPELLTGGSPTDKSDVYSFGITLWQLVHREKPYVVDNKIDLQSTIYKIVKQKKRPQKKVQTDAAIEKLYTDCWEHEQEKRPTMKEVVKSLENYLQT